MRPTLPLIEAVASATAVMLVAASVLSAVFVVSYLAYTVVRLVCKMRGKTLPYFSEVVDDLLSFKWPFKGDSDES